MAVELQAVQQFSLLASGLLRATADVHHLILKLPKLALFGRAARIVSTCELYAEWARRYITNSLETYTVRPQLCLVSSSQLPIFQPI